MLAQRLKQLRRDNDINQIQLAEKMGVTQGTVGRWETGKRTPDFDMLKQLADYFGVSTDYLIRDEHSPELLMLSRLSELPEADKKKLLRDFSDTIDVYLKNRIKN